MEKENKVFYVDYSKVNYRIGIDVCENGSRIYAYDESPGYKIDYHHLIGVVETLKIHLIDIQASHNRSNALSKESLEASRIENKASFDKLHSNDKRVVDCDLPARIYNAIKYHVEDFGRTTISEIMLSDLTKITIRQWLRYRNVGKNALSGLQGVLEKNGFKLTYK